MNLKCNICWTGPGSDLLCREPAVLVVLVLGEDDGEDGMTPAGALVHVGRRHRPRLVPLLHQVVDVLG